MAGVINTGFVDGLITLPWLALYAYYVEEEYLPQIICFATLLYLACSPSTRTTAQNYHDKLLVMFIMAFAIICVVLQFERFPEWIFWFSVCIFELRNVSCNIYRYFLGVSNSPAGEEELRRGRENYSITGTKLRSLNDTLYRYCVEFYMYSSVKLFPKYAWLGFVIVPIYADSTAQEFRFRKFAVFVWCAAWVLTTLELIPWYVLPVSFVYFKIARMVSRLFVCEAATGRSPFDHLMNYDGETEYEFPRTSLEWRGRLDQIIQRIELGTNGWDFLVNSNVVIVTLFLMFHQSPPIPLICILPFEVPLVILASENGGISLVAIFVLGFFHFYALTNDFIGIPWWHLPSVLLLTKAIDLWYSRIVEPLADRHSRFRIWLRNDTPFAAAPNLNRGALNYGPILNPTAIENHPPGFLGKRCPFCRFVILKCGGCDDMLCRCGRRFDSGAAESVFAGSPLMGENVPSPLLANLQLGQLRFVNQRGNVTTARTGLNNSRESIGNNRTNQSFVEGVRRFTGQFFRRRLLRQTERQPRTVLATSTQTMVLHPPPTDFDIDATGSDCGIQTREPISQRPSIVDEWVLLNSHAQQTVANVDPSAERQTVNESQKMTCSICVTRPVSQCFVDCGHLVCKECALEWLREHHHCPNCRTAVMSPPVQVYW
jgi:hypothetical protein